MRIVDRLVFPELREVHKGVAAEAMVCVFTERGMLQLKMLVVYIVIYFAFVMSANPAIWALLSRLSFQRSMSHNLDMSIFLLSLGAGLLLSQYVVLRIFRNQIRQKLAIYLQDLEGVVVEEDEGAIDCKVG